MLEITWATDTTTTLPEGGDVTGLEFDFLNLDIVESDAYEMATDISKNVMESGIPAVDNVTPAEDRYSVTVYLAERPASLTLVPGSTNEATSLAGGRSYTRVTPPEGTTRGADALETLRSLMRDATPVNVDGGPRPLEDWLIETISKPRTVDDAGAMVATITFFEWRVTTLEDVDAPSPRVERGRASTDDGDDDGDGNDDDTEDAAPRGPASRQSAAEYFREQLSDIMSGRRLD